MNTWRWGGLRLGLGLWLFLLLISCGCRPPFLQPPLVGVILWNQDIQSFEENLQGILEGLREEGYLDGLNLSLRVVNATGDRGRAAAAAEAFREQGARLLITLGTVPTLVALEVIGDGRLPVVYSGLGAPAATGLEWVPENAPRFTGTSMEVPAAEQLGLLRVAQPRLQHLGLLFCTATPVAVATGAAVESAARQLGLKVIKVTVTDERPELLQKAWADLLDQGIEALFLPTDPVLASPKNLRAICDWTSRARVPVMAPFESSVMHGALMSYHADFAELGRQTGRQAARILSGAAPQAVPPERPRVKRLTLNVRVAQAMELPLSRHLLSRAHDLF